MFEEKAFEIANCFSIMYNSKARRNEISFEITSALLNWFRTTADIYCISIVKSETYDVYTCIYRIIAL